MEAIKKITGGIGVVSEWAGKIWSFMIVFLVLMVCFEVMMRYVFNAPTQYTYDISYMANAVFISMGFAYVMLHRNHIRVDVLYNRYPPRAKLVFDLVLTLIIFFPFFTQLVISTIGDVVYAWDVGEKTSVTYWYAPTAPYKTLVAIGIILLIVQGAANFVEDLMSLVKVGKKS